MNPIMPDDLSADPIDTLREQVRCEGRIQRRRRMNIRSPNVRRGAVRARILALALLAGVAPAAPAQNAHTLPLVLPASFTGMDGIVRIINRSSTPGEVRIHAIDDTGRRFGPATLALDAKETVNVNSRDLEQGNDAKGLPAGVGDGEGYWRLELDTALDIGPLAYVRTADGILTAMHDVVAVAETCHHVPIFNPGSNQNQKSALRLINPGENAAEVTIIGLDDTGESAPEGAVRLTLAAGTARMVTAWELESGGSGLEGRLGDGTRKWQLFVTSDRNIQVVGLLRSPTGHFVNLSTAPFEPTAEGCRSGNAVVKIAEFAEMEVAWGRSASYDLKRNFDGLDSVAVTFSVPPTVGIPWGTLFPTVDADHVLTVKHGPPAAGTQCGGSPADRSLNAGISLSANWTQAGQPMTANFGEIPANVVRTNAPRRIEGSSALSVTVSEGGSETVTLTDYIEDPDGGRLTFSAGQAPSGLVASTNGARLTVEARDGAEDGAITVTATDTSGECWTFQLRVGVEEHVPVPPTPPVSSVLPEMVVVPGGSFMMGSQNGNPEERPVHRVTIRSFEVGRYEVTFEEWDACVSDGGCSSLPNDDRMSRWGRGRQPVVGVDWDDAKAYVAWLSRKTGKAYRLLSESEWEYAARAGTETAYWWGDGIGINQANCRGCGSSWDDRQPAPVGSFSANAFGLYDVHGNVFEWVEDCYHGWHYRGAPTDGSAWTSDCASTSRVLRGGSWKHDPEHVRSAIRTWGYDGYRDSVVGFRVARTLD